MSSDQHDATVPDADVGRPAMLATEGMCLLLALLSMALLIVNGAGEAFCAGMCGTATSEEQTLYARELTAVLAASSLMGLRVSWQRYSSVALIIHGIVGMLGVSVVVVFAIPLI